ncbi:hypothetical protein R75461_03722 [Paraburkholderia nemoris]|nr:hypothetical protein R75461_03722 [Paraburkholderia nemoris]
MKNLVGCVEGELLAPVGCLLLGGLVRAQTARRTLTDSTQKRRCQAGGSEFVCSRHKRRPECRHTLLR